jgi:hypothetical protein
MVRMSKPKQMRHWRVSFTRRGMEPPMPFGGTKAVVCADSRESAKEIVPASPGYPITASETKDPVTRPYHCRCAADLPTPDEVTASETPSGPEIEREIARISRP